MNIYKTINLINSKIYVGKESKYDPNYLGSGKLLRKAIEKYGVENFVKEILEEVDDEEELNLKEIFWIKELKSTDHNIGYNIALGGNGGDTITNNPNKDCIRKRMSNSAVGFSKNARDAAKESRNKFHPGYGSEIEDSVKISYQKAHSLKMI